MRGMIGMAVVAALAGAVPAAAVPAGAPLDQGMAPGGWGPNGWQDGAAPMAGGPVAPPPMAQNYPASPPMAGGYAPSGYGPAPMARPAPPMVVRRTDYRPLRPGERLHGRWLDPSLVVQDPRPFGLGRPGPGMRWIRYYDDAVMLDGDDRVVTQRGPVRWDAPRGGIAREAMLPPGHPPILPPGHPPVGPGYGMAPTPGDYSYQAGPGTTVTTHVEQVPPPVMAGAAGYDGSGYGYDGYGYPGGYGGAVVSVTPGTITTTTVTTEETSYRTVGGRAVTRARRATPRGKLLRRY